MEVVEEGSSRSSGLLMMISWMDWVTKRRIDKSMSLNLSKEEEERVDEALEGKVMERGLMKN